MSKSARLLAVAIATVAWAALIVQYFLFVVGTWDDFGPALATLRYFSFFTILSNVLVALTTSFALGRRDSRVRRFFAAASLRGGVALFIAVAGLIYFFLLRSTWMPTGPQWLVDKVLHYGTPLSYLAWWLLGVEHGALRWSDPLRWLLFPIAFFGWLLLQGAWAHWYPYPFLDVDALGLATVLRNGVGIGVLFVALGLLIVALDRALAARASPLPPTSGDRAE